MNTAIAYVVAFLFIGAMGGILGSLIAFGGLLGIGKPATWSFLSGVACAMFSYWIGRYFFQWMEVPFTWYAYLLSMVLVVLNDGRRAAHEGPEAIGAESSHARGTMLGIIASITTHFLL